MIEIQIKAKELYDELKQYANYHSDLTHVCSFRDEMSEFLKSYGLEFDEIAYDVDAKPTLTITGKNIMKLENAPAEMLYFVGVKSEFDPTIPIRYMNEVAMLVNQGLVDVSNRFKSLYSKMNYRSKINELIAANVKFYGKGKLTDYIDGDLTIQSLKISNCSEKDIIYRQLRLKVINGLEENGKYWEIKCKRIADSGGVEDRITLRFYNKLPLLRSIAYRGNKINISATKLTDGKNGELYAYDPLILPDGLTLIKDVMYTPPDRKIPVDLYRNAMYEFLYRYSVK